MLRSNKLIIILLLLCFTSNVFSQNRQVPNKPEYDLAPYHFGFLLGINQMLFTIKTFPDFQKKSYDNTSGLYLPDQNSDSAYLFSMESTPTYGFVIGIVSNLRLGDYFDLRFTPSLTFGERYLDYSIKNYSNSTKSQMITVSKNIQSTFVEFPVWMKFKGQRIHNVRPYLLAGGKYAIDLASNSKKKKDSNTSSYVFIKPNDIYASGGVGFDFYTAYFKFGTEITMSYGLRDILVRDGTIYTDPVSRMSSKIFQISFTFE